MTTACDDVALLRFARRSMATSFEIVLPWATDGLERLAATALDVIENLDDQLSVYKQTSEVSRINRIAAHAPVPVEPRLFDLLATAERLWRETGGVFDVTAGPLIKAWGFFGRQGRMPDPAKLLAALECVGMRHVRLDPARRAVYFDRPGVEINLGSIGKGYALDRAADVLRRADSAIAACLNGGTSSVLALGSPTGLTGGWTIGVRHPNEPRRLGVLQVRDRGLGVSGPSEQKFRYNGRTYGHLIDPRTGWPADGVAIAAALAPTAAAADALATAFFVLGVEATTDYCDRHPDIGALIMTPDGVIHAINLGDAEWRLCEANELYDAETAGTDE